MVNAFTRHFINSFLKQGGYPSRTSGENRDFYTPSPIIVRMSIIPSPHGRLGKIKIIVGISIICTADLSLKMQRN